MIFQGRAPGARSRAVLAAVLGSAALLVAVPATAQLDFVERDGVLYVSNVAPVGVAPSAPSSPAPRPSLILARKALYSRVIAEMAARYSVPASLVESLIQVESKFDPRAVSPRGARGLMQLMPHTAAELGVRNVFDARANVEGGVRYLRALLDQYDGDLRLALAAYNAGPAAVARHGGIPPYDETRLYVSRVLDLFGTERAGSAATTWGGRARLLDRHEAADGTVVYTNIPAERLPRATRALLTPDGPAAPTTSGMTY